MTIKIITIFRAQNPGTVLQAYALSAFLSSKGYKNEIINYTPKYLQTGKSPLRAFLSRLMFFPFYVKKSIKYSTFIKENMHITKKRYKNYKQLKENPPYADIYITGSDQVWNCNYLCGNDDAFYLKFIKHGRKLAYAASIGTDVLTPDMINYISERISDYNFISLREISVRNYFDRPLRDKLYYVSDPTFLLSADIYNRLAKKPSVKKYLLVYLVQKSDLLDELIHAVSGKYGLKIVQIGSFTKKTNCDIIVRDLGVKDFLGYIQNADFVIAGSFHATVFSHVFKRNFAVISPGQNTLRITELLKLTGMEQKFVENVSQIPQAIESVSFENADCALERFVQQSGQLLLENIEKK